MAAAFEFNIFRECLIAGFVTEVNDAVAVIDADVQQAKRAKPQNSGDFRAHIVAELGEVEGDHVLILLAQVAKLQKRLIRAVHLLHRPVQPFYLRLTSANPGVRLRRPQ